MMLALPVLDPPNRANALPSSPDGLHRLAARRESPRDLTTWQARLTEIKSAFAQPALSIARQIATFAWFGAPQDTGRHQPQGEIGMPKGEQKGNREKKKPKKEKVKTIAAAPSQKSVGSLQSGYGNKK
jgi:hypothetical protein